MTTVQNKESIFYLSTNSCRQEFTKV